VRVERCRVVAPRLGLSFWAAATRAVRPAGPALCLADALHDLLGAELLQAHSLDRRPPRAGRAHGREIGACAAC
jgi:hypothetical protein